MNATTEPKRQTRSVEVELEIAAPADAVWKAITETDEMKRWFPLDAQTKPGVGGHILRLWGEVCTWRTQVDVWEPDAYLRLVSAAPQHSVQNEAVAAAPTELIEDWHLESRGGTTVLRMVHSGIPTASDWDGEFDGYERGWNFELRALRHYLENHLGKDRTVTWVRQKTAVALQEIWRRLTSRDGLIREGSIDGAQEGDRYDITTAAGDAMSGSVVVHAPPRAFAGTVDQLNDGLFRIEVEGSAAANEVNVWLSTYGVSEREIKEFDQKWSSLLRHLYPEANL